MPKTPQELTASLATLTAEREYHKRRVREIAVKMKRIRAALDRHPPMRDTIIQPMDSPPASPFDELDAILGDD